MKYGLPIQPNHYAVTTKIVEVETGKATIQENDKEVKEVKAENKEAAE